MATWTETAPVLPSGVTYEQLTLSPDSFGEANMQFRFYGSIARLNSSQVAVKLDIQELLWSGGSFARSVKFYTNTLGESPNFSVILPAGSPTDTWLTAKTVYMIADLVPETAVSIEMALYNSRQQKTGYLTLTAPGLLLPKIKAKVDGAEVNIEAIYVRVEGTAVPVESIKFNGG